ncbi:MAG: LCP family protein, partial [Caldilinea sp.]
AELTSPASVAELQPAGDQSQPTQGDQAETTTAGGASTQPIADQPAAELEPVVNILLLGTDERPDEYSPPRTDTIILLSFNPNSGAVGMLSLPRDLWVPLPG